MYRKLLAILMTMCLVAVLFAGCGGKDGDDASNPSASTPSTEEGTVAGAGAALPGQTQSADGEDATGLSGSAGGTAANTQGGSSSGTTKKTSGGGSSSGTTKKPSGGSSSSTTKKPSGGGSSSNTTTKPSGGSTANTKEEIVSYFNQAANQVKTGKPALTYTTTGKMSAFGLSDSFSDDGTTKKGQNLNQLFPVIGQSWASKLPASAVKSAVRTLSNGVYTVKITMNDEKDVLNISNSAHGKAFFFMDTEELKKLMQESDLDVEKLTNNFSGSTITCTIDSKTGNMLSATYVLKDKINTYIKGIPEPMPIQMNITQQFKMAW